MPILRAVGNLIKHSILELVFPEPLTYSFTQIAQSFGNLIAAMIPCHCCGCCENTLNSRTDGQTKYHCMCMANKPNSQTFRDSGLRTDGTSRRRTCLSDRLLLDDRPVGLDCGMSQAGAQVTRDIEVKSTFGIFCSENLAVTYNSASCTSRQPV